MLIRTPRHTTEVHLARIVMPRSRSSSFESSARSATCWLARNAPLWRSIASTRVVFPWSTWAMIAMLRISMVSKAEPRSRTGAGSESKQASLLLLFSAANLQPRRGRAPRRGHQRHQLHFRAGPEMADYFGSAQTADLAADGKRQIAGQAVKETAGIEIARPGGVDDARDRRRRDRVLGSRRENDAPRRAARQGRDRDMTPHRRRCRAEIRRLIKRTDLRLVREQDVHMARDEIAEGGTMPPNAKRVGQAQRQFASRGVGDRGGFAERFLCRW